MSRPIIPDDPETLAAQVRIVHVLRNLLEHFYKCLTRTHTFGAISSRIPEDLVCEMIDIKHAIKVLPPELRQVISLIGLQQMNEYDAADRLGISRKSVNRRMWNAAALIHEHISSIKE